VSGIPAQGCDRRRYALRDCADQLRRLHGISIYITNRERMGDIYIVTARAKDRTGVKARARVRCPWATSKAMPSPTPS